MDKWIDAREERPGDSGDVLVCTHTGHRRRAYYSQSLRHWYACCYRDEHDQIMDDVAYWMPLPNPPELIPAERFGDLWLSINHIAAMAGARNYLPQFKWKAEIMAIVEAMMLYLDQGGYLAPTAYEIAQGEEPT